MAANEYAAFVGNLTGRLPGWYAAELYTQELVSNGVKPDPSMLQFFGSRETVTIQQFAKALGASGAGGAAAGFVSTEVVVLLPVSA